MYGTSQNPYQNKLITNQFIGRPIDNHIQLPIIKNKYRDIEDEKQKLINETLSFVNQKSKRAMAGRGPFINYPLYNQDVVTFLNNYPNSLMHYRPIKYFFQRPVQLDEKLHFPHQKNEILKNRSDFQSAQEIKRSINAKYAKPLTYKDLVGQAQELELPMAKVITAGEVNHKIEELNKIKDELFKLDPKRKMEIRKRNKTYWRVMSQLNKVLVFWRILNEFKAGSMKYKQEVNVVDRSFRADLIDLFKYISENLMTMEEFIIDNLGEYITFNSGNQKKNEESVFKVKHFIHKLFHDLSITVSDKSDIDINIRSIILSYISNNKTLPSGFLTTMDFNRLQFGIDWGTRMMNKERQAMVVCNLILYKVVINEILKNPRLYFKKMDAAKPGGGSNTRTIYDYMEVPKGGERIKKTKEELELEEFQRKDIVNVLNTNFTILRGIVNFIVKDAFKASPDQFQESIKEEYMFPYYVVNGVSYGGNKLKKKLIEDENEFSMKVDGHEQVSLFIRDNQRWINMYRMNAYAYCVNLVSIINLSEKKDFLSRKEVERQKRIEMLAEQRNNNEIFGDDDD